MLLDYYSFQTVKDNYISQSHCVGCTIFLLFILSRQKRPGYKHSIAIAISTACFMLPWQVSLYFLLVFSLAGKTP